MKRENEKSCNLCWLRLFFLRVQVLGNTLTDYIFPVTFDSKTDSKTGGQQWISVDEARHSIGLWSEWKTLVDVGRRVMPKGGLGMISDIMA